MWAPASGYSDGPVGLFWTRKAWMPSHSGEEWSHQPPSVTLLCQAVASHPRTPVIGPQPPVLSLCELGHQSIITGTWIQEPPHLLLYSYPATPRGCRIPCPKPLLSLGAGRLLPHIPSSPPALSLGAELWSRMISCNWPATWLPDLFYRHAG